MAKDHYAIHSLRRKKIPKESFVDKQPRIAPTILVLFTYLGYGVRGNEIS